MGGRQFPAAVMELPSPAQFQEARQGSLCNQAIMLLTDGAVEDYEPVFEKYNQLDRKVTPWWWSRGERRGCQGGWSPTAMMGWPRKARPAMSSNSLPISPSVNSNVPKLW